MPDRPHVDLASALHHPHVLREYALLADGERGIVVGPRGDFAWMCFPRWDDEALFSSLLGGQGAYAVTPEGRYVWGGYYEHGLIWRSRWVGDGGAEVECREALALPASPTRAVILRRVAVLRGQARVRVLLHPRAGFGREPLTGLKLGDDGVWRGDAGGVHVAWAGGADAQPQPDGHRGKALVLDLDMEAGEEHDLVLVCDRDPDGAAPPEPERAWAGTVAEWERRVPGLDATHATARRDARHSYAVLSGLTSAGGGMVAAATMSLPERAREGRNYDYRYVWIRDQCYTGQAVAAAGPYPLMDDAVRFVTERLLADGPQLMPAYTVTGAPVPEEREIDLPGYPGGGAVAGNWVRQQFQLDAFGEALLLFAAAAGHDHVDADTWRAAETAIDAIEARWREADAGVWELDPDEWTHSRLMCAAGLRAVAGHQPEERGARWMALADAIVADVSATSVHPSGRWQRSPGDERLDAALLLPAIRGAVPADDPRSIATLHAVEDELAQDGYCYRYRPDERPLGRAEGAFLLCGFIMALGCQTAGETTRAARWFERNRAACGPAGLFSEEFDVTQRQLRGNLPQAFVHALLLECAVRFGPDPADR